MLLYPITFAHNSFPFNAHLAADGSAVIANAQNTVTVDRRIIDTQFREGRDAYQLATGGSLGRAHKGFGILRLWGRILVPMATQDASLSDKERAMLAAFDPELCSLDSPSTDGAYAFDFSEPTLDTTNYANGRIPLRYYARPAARPSIEEVYAEGTFLRYALVLAAADPRCYEQTAGSLVLTAGTPTGDVVNKGTVPAPLKVTIVMAGAGASNFTITRGGVAFILDLSTATAGQSVVVVMETCAPYGRGKYITKAGVEAASLKTSSPSTWLNAPVGTTSFTITNTTNVTSATLAWYSARA